MAKQFDKAKWIEDSRVRVEKAKEALEAGLAALQSSDDWKRTLTAMAALGPARINRLYAEDRIMPRVTFRSAVRSRRARHNPGVAPKLQAALTRARSKLVEERQESVARAKSPGSNAKRCRLRQYPLLQLHARLEVDVRRLDGLVAEPKRDGGAVDPAVKEVHRSRVPQDVRRDPSSSE